MSAYTQVKNGRCSIIVEIPKSESPDILDTSTNEPKSWSSITFELDCCVKGTDISMGKFWCSVNKTEELFFLRIILSSQHDVALSSVFIVNFTFWVHVQRHFQPEIVAIHTYGEEVTVLRIRGQQECCFWFSSQALLERVRFQTLETTSHHSSTRQWSEEQVQNDHTVITFDRQV